MTLSIMPPVLARVYSPFFAAQGPMKTTRAVGSECLMSLAVVTMGDTDEEMASLNSGKFFSTKLTKAGQHEVVMMAPSPFSWNSRASL